MLENQTNQVYLLQNQNKEPKDTKILTGTVFPLFIQHVYLIHRFKSLLLTLLSKVGQITWK